MKCIFLEKSQFDDDDSFGVNVQRVRKFYSAISNPIHLLLYAPCILQPLVLQPAI
jgi:hypothetical protein